MTRHFTQLFTRRLEEAAILRGLEAVLAREGYCAFEAGRIPAGYPAHPREFLRVAVSDPDPDGVIAILFEHSDRGFSRALALSKEWPGTDLIAVVKPPLEDPRFKVYRNGELVLKVGEDPDEELFYLAPVSPPDEVERFVQCWCEDRSRRGGIEALRLRRRDCRYSEAVAGGWPSPLRERVFVERRSRLYLESGLREVG
jgi:hypothetical protein